MTPTTMVPDYVRVRERRGTRDSIPEWTRITIDGLIASGMLRVTDLDGMTADQLAELARFFRRTAVGIRADLDAVREGA